MEPTLENKSNQGNVGNPVITDVEGVGGEYLLKKQKLFNTRTALSLPEGHLDVGGISEDLIGLIMLGGSALGIVRARRDGEERVVVSKIDKSGNSINYLSSIKPGIPVIIGRDNVDKHDGTISSKHLILILDENGLLSIEDVSMNGSTFLSFEQKKNDEAVAVKGLRKLFKPKKDISTEKIDIKDYIENTNSWGLSGITAGLIFEDDSQSAADGAVFDYTRIPIERSNRGIITHGYEEPSVDAGIELPAKYQGRPVIGRDSQINGGVYIVPGIQEAIVVDDGTRPKEGGSKKPLSSAYERAFNTFLMNATSKKIDVLHGVKSGQEMLLLSSLLDSAMDVIQYDLKTAELAEKRLTDLKVNLEGFIKDGKGVCRHQALLVGYILERLIKGGYIEGKCSVDRSYIPGKGGHAWARYESKDETIYIIDPAQKYVGTLRDSLTLKDAWSYSRPDDRF